MRTVSRWIVGATAAAIILTVVAPFAGAQEKKLKDGERELYEPATQAVGAQNWAKAVPALEAWKQKFPDSEFKDDRDFYILQGYLVTQQFPKAITFGNDFMDNNVPGLSKSNPGYVIAAYFVVTTAASQLIQKDATDEQIRIGDKAAHKLLEFSPTYFVAANQPAGETPQSFANRRTQMEATANGYLLTEAVAPGTKAEAKKDCPAAEAAFSKALMTYPDNSWISRHLASAYNCEQKPFMAMYEFARTAAVDPTQGKTTDGPKFVASVKKMYVTLHGGEDGLDQLMQQAKATPIPPADFKIETDDERKIKQGEEFAKANPEIAAWTNIKTNLTTQGAPFFESMKGAELPQLLGTIADAKPACNPKELVLYVPAPENSAKTTEIAVKFETPLKGKPEIGSNIKFVAVADAFAPAPFLLTMTAEKEKVQDLKLSPCTVARPASKKKE
jgi:Outer membrane lipoprotein